MRVAREAHKIEGKSLTNLAKSEKPVRSRSMTPRPEAKPALVKRPRSLSAKRRKKPNGKKRRPQPRGPRGGRIPQRKGKRATSLANVVPKASPAMDNKLDNFMSSINPYLHTVLDPFNCLGVRIPYGDIPSSTLNIRQRFQLTTGSTGCLFAALGCAPWKQSYSGTDQISIANQCSLVPNELSGYDLALATKRIWSYGYGGYSVKADLSSGASILFPTATADWSTITLPGWTATDKVVPGTYSEIRLVSAGITITPLGAVTSSQGLMVMAFLPCDSFPMDYDMHNITVEEVYYQPLSCVIPLNKIQGGTIIYKPEDLGPLEYRSLNDGSTDAESLENDPNLSPGGFWILIQDYAPDSAFLFEVSLNYEAIPKQNTLNVGVEPPLQDLPMLDHALQVLGSVPNAHIGTAQTDVSLGQNVFRSCAISPKHTIFNVPKPIFARNRDHTFEANHNVNGRSVLRVNGPQGVSIPQGINWKGIWGGIKDIGVSTGKTMLQRLMTEWVPMAAKMAFL